MSSYRSNLLLRLKEIQEGYDGMTEIVPGLYVGSFRDSKDLRQLDIRKITHILSICDDARKIFKDKKYLIIGAADSPKQDLAQYFPLCNDFIHPARIRGGHVLIHCLAGISRSVTVAAAYLLSTVQTLNHQEALQAVRAARIVASPNIGFQKQLADFEHHGLDCERQRLAEKFRPRTAVIRPSTTAAFSPHAQTGAQLAANSGAGSCGSGVPGVGLVVAGRLSVRTETSSSPETDNLTLGDAERCRSLLETYRRKVSDGEICGGDCADGGISCPSGVCRAHNRSYAPSFLRRGSTNHRRGLSLGKLSCNMWSILPQDQIRSLPRRSHSDKDLHRPAPEAQSIPRSPFRHRLNKTTSDLNMSVAFPHHPEQYNPSTVLQNVLKSETKYGRVLDFIKIEEEGHLAAQLVPGVWIA
ncbi:hypothetical protein TCAL_03708 [Tigriopus californicus]|uniref:Dual specificity protein phosphatase 15 n=1 Tax=Tigriopus californicus TaxID=6832 RepID=A0A553N9P5_TIGCA|nr:hypothetical protein TCAL_03708 [Tigriopus californicus]